MTGHIDRHVDVDLQVVSDTLVDGKGVRGLAIQVFLEFVPDESCNEQPERDSHKSSAR